MQRHESEPQGQEEPKVAPGGLEGARKIRLEFELPQVPRVAITRRQFLAGLGTLGLLGAGYALGSSQKGEAIKPSLGPSLESPKPISPSERAVLPEELARKVEAERSIQTQAPKKEPTPERRGVVWKTEMALYNAGPAGGVPDSFYVGKDMIILSDKDGVPSGYSNNDFKNVWEWNEEGRIHGVDFDKNTAFILRGQRLYQWDLKSNKQIEMLNLDLPNGYYPEPWIKGKEVSYFPFGLPHSTWDRVLLIKKDNGNEYWHKGFLLADSQNTFLAVDLSSRRTADVLIFDKQEGKPIFKFDQKAARGLLLGNLAYSQEQMARFDIFKSAGIAGDFLAIISSSMLSQDNKDLQVIDLRTGGILWHKSKSALEIMHVSAERLYVRNAQGILQVFDLQSGNEMGQFPSFTRGDFAVEVDGVMLAYSESRQVLSAFGWLKEVSWEKDIQMNRLVGATEKGLVVGVYNSLPAKGQQPPILSVFDLKSGEKKWRSRRLEKVSHKVMLFGDTIAYGDGGKVKIGNAETGEFWDGVTGLKYTKQARIDASWDKKTVLVQDGFSPGFGFGPPKPAKGVLVAVRV